MTHYRVIVADPPWKFGDRLTMSKTKRGAASQYETLSTIGIAALPVERIASAESVLALWCPSSMLTDGLHVMAAWGFKQKGIFTWVKTSASGLAFGMGHTFRAATEHALIGTRGSPKIRNRSQRSVALDLALPHSAKPETLQDRLELMVDGPWLELFARRDRQRWTCTGLECPSTRGVDIRDWLERNTDGQSKTKASEALRSLRPLRKGHPKALKP